jgi:excinuclease ABC subunit A
MTELCDYFKVWFCHTACLHDPSTGKILRQQTPESVWNITRKKWPEKKLLISFQVPTPKNLPPEDILNSLISQGYARILLDGKTFKTEEIHPEQIQDQDCLDILQDRVSIHSKNRTRFIESAQTAFKYGKQKLSIFSSDGEKLQVFQQGLRSPETGITYRSPTPAMFSFNSPLGACPECKGFGRVIEIDYRLVIPDPSLSIEEGAIKAFHGKVHSQSQRDLIRSAKKIGVRINQAWKTLDEWEKKFVLEGEEDYVEDDGRWYGLRRFFTWMEGRKYKMHIRVFLSRFRAYLDCPSCSGTRFQPETLNWKWKGKTLPDLYETPITELQKLLQPLRKLEGHKPIALAAHAILARLDYLEQVGVGYLTLNRTSRTLSGGESQRVKLTSCLGTSLTDTIFVLDEPSVGLHSRDIDQLLQILRRLVNAGNTVVVVEH